MIDDQQQALTTAAIRREPALGVKTKIRRKSSGTAKD